MDAKRRGVCLGSRISGGEKGYVLWERDSQSFNWQLGEGVTVTTGCGAGINREESSYSSSWKELVGGPMTEYVGCLRYEA